MVSRTLLALGALFITFSTFACSSAPAEDDTGEALGAATTAAAEGESCSRSTENACASGLKCTDGKCTRECSSYNRCPSGSFAYCIPSSSYSSSGICSKTAADEDDACIDTDKSCGSGLKCDSHKCVKTCTQYSYCGYKTCIPDSSYSSQGTCKTSKSNLGQPCFEDKTCNYGQKCKYGTCHLD
jgi:hypothetical protein